MTELTTEPADTTNPDEAPVGSTPEAAETNPAAEPETVRTAAFLADGRVSTYLLRETVAALLTRQEIQSALVDISTEAGLATAHQLIESGVEYRIFDTVPPKWDSEDRMLLDLVLSESRGKVSFDPENISAVDANIVLIPAPATDAGIGIDATEGTITALVIDQLKEADENCLILLPPESGLRRQEDGRYVRLTLRLE